MVAPGPKVAAVEVLVVAFSSTILLPSVMTLSLSKVITGVVSTILMVAPLEVFPKKII